MYSASSTVFLANFHVLTRVCRAMPCHAMPMESFGVCPYFSFIYESSTSYDVEQLTARAHIPSNVMKRLCEMVNGPKSLNQFPILENRIECWMVELNGIQFFIYFDSVWNSLSLVFCTLHSFERSWFPPYFIDKVANKSELQKNSSLIFVFVFVFVLRFSHAFNER